LALVRTPLAIHADAKSNATAISAGTRVLVVSPVNARSTRAHANMRATPALRVSMRKRAPWLSALRNVRNFEDHR
jgi:hypothetical protein